MNRVFECYRVAAGGTSADHARHSLLSGSADRGQERISISLSRHIEHYLPPYLATVFFHAALSWRKLKAHIPPTQTVGRLSMSVHTVYSRHAHTLPRARSATF